MMAWMYALIFLFAAPVDTIKSCDLEITKNPRYRTLTIEKAELRVKVLGADAEIRKCEPVKNLDSIYVVELDKGTAGTKAQSGETSLLIVRKEKKKLVTLTEKTIEETKDEGDVSPKKTSIRRDYKIQADGNAKKPLVLELSNPWELISIQLN